jgi:hypothetical protein
MKILLLLLLPTLLCAQTRFDLPPEEIDPASEDILIKRPEQYQRHESVIYDLNTDLGIKDQRRYTGTDKNRFSLSGHVSGDYEHWGELLGLEAVYMRRSDRYNRLWYGAQVMQVNTQFGAVTQNPTTGSDINSDTKVPRPDDAKNSILGLGLGVGYRFKLLLDFFRTEDTFENIDVFANAVRMKENFNGQDYSGWGLTTSYGIHKRASTSFFYGGKLTYNLASVTRSAVADEPKRERSLSLGWTSLAFEFGYFF